MSEFEMPDPEEFMEKYPPVTEEDIKFSLQVAGKKRTMSMNQAKAAHYALIAEWYRYQALISTTEDLKDCLNSSSQANSMFRDEIRRKNIELHHLRLAYIELRACAATCVDDLTDGDPSMVIIRLRNVLNKTLESYDLGEDNE